MSLLILAGVIYELFKQGKIRAVLIKTNRHNTSGKRVFLRESLDSYLASLADEQQKTPLSDGAPGEPPQPDDREEVLQ